jgi:methyl-accepting chemotaxis protein
MLKKKVILTVFTVVVSIFAVAIIFLSTQANKIIEEMTLNVSKEMAMDYSQKIKFELEKSMTVVKTLAQNYEGLKSSNFVDRELYLSGLKNIFEKNPTFIGMSSGWEPNALDGKDEQFIGRPYHDKTGRFLPYVYRDTSNKVQITALEGYETDEWYQLPKKIKSEIITEPYVYPVNGKNVFMTTMTAPIIINDNFLGVTTVDIALDYLQEIASKIKPFGGYANIISNNGIYVASGFNSSLIGKGFEDKDVLSNANKSGIYSRSIYSNLLKTDVKEIFVPLYIGKTDTPWYLSISMPIDEMLKDSKYLRNIITAIAVISLSVLFVILYISIGKLIQPLIMFANEISTIESDLTK